jgi:hypothetical protein
MRKTGDAKTAPAAPTLLLRDKWCCWHDCYDLFGLESPLLFDDTDVLLHTSKKSDDFTKAGSGQTA